MNADCFSIINFNRNDMQTELINIIQAYRQIDFSSKKAALATILNVEGSSYRRPGARMLIVDDGNWTGAISGGCLEKDALRKALHVIQSNKARVITYDTSDEEDNAFGIGLGCNGIINVLMEPLHPEDKGNPVELLAQLLTNKERAVMTTIFGNEADTGQRKIFSHDLSGVSTISDSMLESVIDKTILETPAGAKTQVLRLETGHSVLIEVLTPDIQLLVFGAGYDAVPLVKMAKLAGCHVTVVNDNPNHLNSALLSEADERVFSLPEETLDKVIVNQYCAAVLVSHNFNYDLAILRLLLTTGIQYIGILGPKKKRVKLFEKLTVHEDGDLQRIFNPVGLDIGAETPAEIALSIVAEIKAVFNKREGQMLKFKEGSVHSV